MPARAVLEVAAVLARAGHQPVHGAALAIGRQIGADARAIAAIAQARAPAQGLAGRQQVEGVHGLVAHGAHGGGKARVGRGRAGLHLDALEQRRVHQDVAGVVPHRSGLARAVYGHGQHGLLEAQHIDALRHLRAPADRDARFALEDSGRVARLQALQVFARDHRAAGGLDLLLAVFDHGDLVQAALLRPQRRAQHKRQGGAQGIGLERFHENGRRLKTGARATAARRQSLKARNGS
jgi:hypothetical protein